MDTELALKKQEYEAELKKVIKEKLECFHDTLQEEEETRRIEEMLKAGNSTLEALKLQEEQQKKAEVEFDRRTKE